MGGVKPDRGSILVVDDEPTIAEVVARYLARAGYDAQTAEDGPAAAAAPGPAADLVVLDIMLPGLDGLEVMRRLHEDPASACPSSCSRPRARRPTASWGCGRGPTTTW